MLLGIKSWKEVFLRHLLVAIVSAVLLYLFWQVHSSWSPDVRLWKAFGATSFFLLWFTVIIGPLAKIWPKLIRFVPWRRESGIWFALVSLVHGYLILDGWARWNTWQFLGYQYMRDLDMYVLSEPGFGLANLMGLMALTFALALAATSSDKAVSYLGISSWKWLHNFTYVIFYLIVLHVMYYAFIHYSLSLDYVLAGITTTTPPNPLRYYYLAGALSVVLAQLTAFIKTIRQRRRAGGN